MKKAFKKFAPILVLFFLTRFSASGQTPQHAGEYMTLINQNYAQVKQDTWDYMVAVANNRSAKKIDKRRTELMTSLTSSKNTIARIKPWEGDASLRDSAVSFLSMSYYILNHDYAKIIDMEEVAEQSYDAMEAYLLARKTANARYSEAAERLNLTNMAFATLHNVNLLENDDDKLSKKIQLADTVLSYYDRVYLIMFKSQIQETYVMQALAKADVASAEQNKNKLLENSLEGLKMMGAVPSFMGDATLKTATAELLNFFKMEAQAKFPVLIDFYLKKENFEKMKSAMDAKPKGSITKEDSDAYNKAVDEYNKAVASYNTVNNEANANRAKFIGAWNAAGAAFTEKHVPNK